MEPYAGKSDLQSNKPIDIIIRLAKVIKGSSRNITMDRYYSSIDLADILWHNFKLTMVGNIQSNRNHLPNIIKNTSETELCFSTSNTPFIQHKASKISIIHINSSSVYWNV